MAIRICDLTPGDRWVSTLMGDGIFITKAPHPLFDGLELVVWWLVNSKHYTFDAMRSTQELPGGTLDTTNRKGNLREAIIEAAQIEYRR